MSRAFYEMGRGGTREVSELTPGPRNNPDTAASYERVVARGFLFQGGALC